MSTSQVELYNHAISASGGRAKISSTTERSREAEVCELWYPIVRDNVLGAAFWPSARKFRRLAVQAERDFALDWTETDPAPTWRYAYSTPSDMLRPRYLASGARFEVGLIDDNTASLFTNEESALLAYTFRQTNILAWEPQLRMAVTLALAARLAMPTSGKVNRADELMREAQMQVLTAQETFLNSANTPVDSIPPWLQARGYEGAMTPTTFYYPLETLTSLSL